MSDELESKVPVETEEHAAGDTAHGLNALELLGGAATTGAVAGAAAAADGKIVKDFGKLELTDKTVAGAMSELLKHGDELGNKFEKYFEPKEMLSRTERLMLSGMQDAIRSGDMGKVQEMLETLAENPKSVDRVLRALNKEMQDENGLNSASWEQGKDSNGNSFVRLRLNNRNDWSKSSGSTEVTIGSDGRHSAQYTKTFMSPATQVDPGMNMGLFGPQRFKPENWNPRSDWSGYKKGA